MIYLDSAATSLLKPPAVIRAVHQAMSGMSSPGRGSYAAAVAAGETVYECRENIARLCAVEKPENVVFTFNATHGLNIAIANFAHRGARAFVSGWEHNAVMRPLWAYGVEAVAPMAALFDNVGFLCQAEKLLDKVSFAVCTHVSNVFGWVLPIYELAEMCRRKNVPLIVDASQSAGVEDVNFTALGAEFVAFPGHKGLLGPQGTGVLLCKNEAKPLLYGGSGSSSRLPAMPDYLPERLEAGTVNTPGIAGLNEGVRYILSKGTAGVRRHERRLLELFVKELEGEEGIRLFYSPDSGRQSSVISLLPEKRDCEDLAEALGRMGIAVRSGLHCAPAAHESGGTLGSGTVRFSFSPFISAAQARTASHGLKKILKKA